MRVSLLLKTIFLSLSLLLGMYLSVGATSTTALNSNEPEKIVVVSEPGMTSEDIQYYQSKWHVDSNTFTWSDNGKSGKALLLDGKSQTLRLSSTVASTLSSFTFSAWINWQGNLSEDNAADNQKLLSVFKNESSYFSVSPHTQDTSRKINGIYMTLEDRTANPISLFYPASSISNFALPTHEWHHIAVTLSDTSMTLYVDGVRFLHRDISISYQSLNMNTFVIGGGIYGESTLNALIDDAYIYKQALTDTQVALLFQGASSLLGNTTVTMESLATNPNPNEIIVTTQADSENPVLSFFTSIPAGLIILITIVILLAVSLSVFFSLQDKNKQQRKEMEEDIQ